MLNCLCFLRPLGGRTGLREAWRGCCLAHIFWLDWVWTMEHQSPHSVCVCVCVLVWHIPFTHGTCVRRHACAVARMCANVPWPVCACMCNAIACIMSTRVCKCYSTHAHMHLACVCVRTHVPSMFPGHMAYVHTQACYSMCVCTRALYVRMYVHQLQHTHCAFGGGASVLVG